MDGFHSPTRCPRKESMTAVEPFSCGALKLVPPQPPWRVGWPIPANDGSYSREALSGDAVVARAGTARPEPWPWLTPGVGLMVHAVGSFTPGAMFWTSVGVRYWTAWKFCVPDTPCW